MADSEAPRIPAGNLLARNERGLGVEKERGRMRWARADRLQQRFSDLK